MSLWSDSLPHLGSCSHMPFFLFQPLANDSLWIWQLSVNHRHVARIYIKKIFQVWRQKCQPRLLALCWLLCKGIYHFWDWCKRDTDVEMLQEVEQPPGAQPGSWTSLAHRLLSGLAQAGLAFRFSWFCSFIFYFLLASQFSSFSTLLRSSFHVWEILT